MRASFQAKAPLQARWQNSCAKPEATAPLPPIRERVALSGNLATQREKQTQLTSPVDGTVKARVDTVSSDAVTDEKRGSFYPAILTLEKKDMLIDGKQIPISPGMNVTAEIKTGKRRVIEFLLSPVQRMGSESLRER